MSESIINIFNLCLSMKKDSEVENCEIKLKRSIDLIILEKNLYLFSICILYLSIFYELNIFTNLMKYLYRFSLYLVGYNNKHDDIHRLECKLEHLEEMYYNLNQKISQINVKLLECVSKEDSELIKTELIKTELIKTK